MGPMVGGLVTRDLDGYGTCLVSGWERQPSVSFPVVWHWDKVH